MQPEKFALMDGAGNRFAALDLRGVGEYDLAAFPLIARTLCENGDGRVLDGLLVLVDAADANNAFDLLYFNRDGSRAGFCGNGARCASVLAYPGKTAEFTFGSDSGAIESRVRIGGAAIRMPIPSDCAALSSEDVPGLLSHRITVGVPHLIVWCEDGVEWVDVSKEGARLRAHPALGPEGANVNFTSEVNPTTIRTRTYERGVEAETGACGTGAAASAIAHAVLRDRRGTIRTSVLPTSTAELIVTFQRDGDGVRDLWLEGPARLVEWRSCAKAQVS